MIYLHFKWGGGYSKSEVDTLLNGKADTSHTHTKSQITDFPSYGTTSGTICEGNDSRLSDARTPTSHTHTKSEITDFPTLSTVATSGSYNDLSNKPTIPTVNNATLTIQKNGTTVKTFTANASSNVTCNITVPTNTNELTNGAGFVTKNELCSLIYPIGSIYLSVNSVDPSTIFGGTWEKIKDKFLLSSGDTYSIGSTGGNSSTTLEIANLPSHNHTGTTGNQSANHTHTFSGTSSTNGSHSHTTWTDSQGYHSHNSGHGWHNVEPGPDRHCLSDNYIDSDEWSGNITSSTGTHGHNVYMNDNGSHNHTYSGTTSGISANHTHSFTTSSVGSTQAFSNMPPYLAVNVWKRTA